LPEELIFILIYSNNITGFSIGASKIDLGEFTESNGHVCDDVISVLGGSGLVVVKCLQNMALLIMTKLYNRKIKRRRRRKTKSGIIHLMYRTIMC
jgi:hypothetical protein